MPTSTDIMRQVRAIEHELRLLELLDEAISDPVGLLEIIYKGRTLGHTAAEAHRRLLREFKAAAAARKDALITDVQDGVGQVVLSDSSSS